MSNIDQSQSLLYAIKIDCGNGEFGQILQHKDWSESTIGHPNTWQKSLYTSLSMLLNSKVPMFLCWGSKLVFFYNEAYRSLFEVSQNNTLLIGMQAHDVYKEMRHINLPVITEVFHSGESISEENQLIQVNRDGSWVDICCTFNYSSVSDDFAKRGGVLVICTDTTELTNLKKATKHNTINLFTTSESFNDLNNFNDLNKNSRNAVMKAPVGIAILQGSSLIVSFANDIWLNIMGKNELQCIGKSFLDSLPEFEESARTMILSVLKTGEPLSIVEFPVTVYKGKEILKSYFNINYQAIKNCEEVISGILVICTDVTPLVKAKYKLAESEKQFRNMVMQSPVSMAILRGKDFIIEITNPSMLKNIWQKSETDIIGKRFLDVLPEMLNQKYFETLKTVYSTKTIIKEKEVLKYLYMPCEDSLQNIYYDFESAPLFDQDGTVTGIMVTANDVTEKVEARQVIEIEEARLRMATEGTRLATWDLDLKTEKLVHSSMLSEIFGFPPSAILKHQEIYSQIHPLDVHGILSKAFEEAKLTSIYNCELRIIRLDNSIRWIRTQGKIIFGPDQLPSRMIGTLLDITDKKILEEEVIRIAAIVQSSEDAIISKNLEGFITSWNNAAEKMFGFKANEIIGQPILLLTPRNYLMKDADVINRIEKENGVYCFESHRLKKDNTEINVSLSVSNIKDIQGNIIGMSTIVKDITSRKKVEKEIAAGEAKFQLLANSMAQFIWISDTEGNLNYFNDSVYNYSDKTTKDLEKDGWLSIVHPDDRADNIIKWKKSIATGNDFIVEHRFRRRDGEYRWQLSRALPQRDSNGKIQMWVGTSTDIQEIKENEQQKDFFISMASHELKTPVTTIKGYVQILLSMYKDKGDEVLKKSLEIVNKQIITLTSLITDLLDLSKIKSGSLQLKKEHFCINDLISEIVVEIQLTEPKTIIEFEETINTMVFLDRGRIGQVLINFLTNAIKYSPNSNSVKVTLDIMEKELLVAVTDHGIGISKSDQQKIFQRFYRVSGRDEKTFPGFGIGLFIAAEIIHRHHGKIGVESNIGKGSVFYFSLPLNN